MSLFKSMMTVSSFTMLSRITGLIRESLMARMFGASIYTDAFNVAFKIPNLLRRLFAEGAFSQAFVPILTDYEVNQGAQKSRHMISAVATVMFWVLLTVTTTGILASPFIVMAFASGFKSQTYDIALTLTRIIFPYIFFVSLVVLGAAILNTHKKFSLSAVTPVLLNFAMIIAMLIAPKFNVPIYVVGTSVVVGGMLQLIAIWVGLKKIDMVPKIRLNFISAWQSPAVKQIVQRMIPAIFAVSATQVSLLINTNYSSFLKAGSISWLNYADRLMEFPTALIGVALGTVLMPALSRDIAQKNYFQYNQTMDWGLRLVILLTIPAMIGMFLMGPALVSVLFQYGKFTKFDVFETNQALTGYAFGILALILIKILAPGYYSHKDVKTPMLVALMALASTQLANLFFVPKWHHAGLAASISVGALVNASFLYWGLRRKNWFTPEAGWALFLCKVIFAAFALSIFFCYINQYIDWTGMAGHPILRLIYLVGAIIMAAVVYFGVLLTLGMRMKKLQ